MTREEVIHAIEVYCVGQHHEYAQMIDDVNNNLLAGTGWRLIPAKPPNHPGVFIGTVSKRAAIKDYYELLPRAGFTKIRTSQLATLVYEEPTSCAST